jgi:HPr kinase/phosphorylase
VPAPRIPLFVSDRTTSVVIQSITRVLEDELAPSTTLHGVLVDVYGMGVLLLGESGIGKSECALDLVHRGHRLVADDAVEIRRYPSGRSSAARPR